MIKRILETQQAGPRRNRWAARGPGARDCTHEDSRKIWCIAKNIKKTMKYFQKKQEIKKLQNIFTKNFTNRNCQQNFEKNQFIFKNFKEYQY